MVVKTARNPYLPRKSIRAKVGEMVIPITALLSLYLAVFGVNAQTGGLVGQSRQDAICVRSYGEGYTYNADTGQCETSDTKCLKEYHNPATGDWECCPKGTKFTVAPDQDDDELGACCKPGQQVTVSVGVPGCCAKDQKFQWDVTTKTGTCVPPRKDDDVKPFPDDDDDNDSASCSKNAVCPKKDGYFGIQYGHCYTLMDTNGKQLGREVAQYYRTGGEVNNLVFRVCGATDDCSKNLGKYVKINDTTGSGLDAWYMQDQNGVRGQRGPAFWGDYYPHNYPTQDVRHAAHFGDASVYCLEGKCAVCLRYKGPIGLDAPCQMGGAEREMTHIGPSDNPASCKAFQFFEVPCLKQ